MNARRRGTLWLGGCVVALLAGVFWLAGQVLPLAGVAASNASRDLPAASLNANLPASTPEWSPPGLDLVGRVASTNGEPVPGAVVAIDSAAPRVGRGYT
jgi:hypothetical protein